MCCVSISIFACIFGLYIHTELAKILRFALISVKCIMLKIYVKPSTLSGAIQPVCTGVGLTEACQRDMIKKGLPNGSRSALSANGGGGPSPFRTQ